MSKTRYFHGTTFNAYQAILKEGFLNGYIGEQRWSCSSGYNYFWNSQKLAELEELDDWSNEDLENFCINRTKESAECGFVFEENPIYKRVVIEFDLSGLEILDDTSCENMDGAVYVSEPVDISRIKNVWVDDKELKLFTLYFENIGRDIYLSMNYNKKNEILDSIPGETFQHLWQALQDIELVKI